MKVLFLNPPFKSEFGRFSREQRSPAITKGGTLYYPIWLCYSVGLLEKKGFTVKLIDAPADRLSLEAVLKQVSDFNPRLVVIDTSTPSIFSDIQIGETIKKRAGAFTILVGTHPTALPEETLKVSSFIDAIARREYEYTLLDVARVLSETLNPSISEWKRIDGLSFQSDGKTYHNPDRAFIQNLDEIPFVAGVYKKHLTISQYFYTIAQYPQVAIYSGRGCPHGCFYCVYPQVMHGRGYRKRSIQNLIEEFKFIEEQLPEVKEVFIEDDSFTIDKARVKTFCDAYQRAKLTIPWITNSRADIDGETLQMMKAANCRLLCVGFESGSKKVLNGLKKNLDLKKARAFVQNANRLKILIHGCFLFGGPGETPETMEETLRFAKQLSLDTAQFFPIMVYPGTEAFQWAKENNFLTSEDFSQWVTHEGLHNSLISRPEISHSHLVAFCDHARREFYLRLKYISRRLLRFFLHPLEDGPRLWKSFSVFWKFLLLKKHSGVDPQ